MKPQRVCRAACSMCTTGAFAMPSPFKPREALPEYFKKISGEPFEKLPRQFDTLAHNEPVELSEYPEFCEIPGHDADTDWNRFPHMMIQRPRAAIHHLETTYRAAERLDDAMLPTLIQPHLGVLQTAFQEFFAWIDGVVAELEARRDSVR